jgi:prolyl 4-hydroxylase
VQLGSDDDRMPALMPFVVSCRGQVVNALPTIASWGNSTTGVVPFIRLDAVLWHPRPHELDCGISPTLLKETRHRLAQVQVEIEELRGRSPIAQAARRALGASEGWREIANQLPSLFQSRSYWSVLRRSSPRMLYVTNTLPQLVCEELIRLANTTMQRSLVVSDSQDTSKHFMVSALRTSSGAFLSRPSEVAHPANVFLRLKLVAVTGIPEENFEETQVLRYRRGERYVPHLDTFDRFDVINLEHGGQRVATAVTWLNGVAEGGGTRFPSIGNVSIAPRAGDSVVFYSVNEAMDAIEEGTRHAGDPPEGPVDKWIAVLWIHPRRWGWYR